MSKRQKTENISEKFRTGLFEKESTQVIEKAFKESKPYLHCKIDKLVNDNLLRRVRKEILSNISFTLKETDIYKVNQTGDLANLDGLPKSELKLLSSVFELRNAIYSSEFRDFISAVTDCGPLSGSKMDMSINSYQEGCHLLNHDDVIGTRRVSYILYLTDPDHPWDAKDGGALELYPVIEKGTPASEPTVIIPPQWNQFVMFTVQPGHSFHSVEEVVGPGNRLSISGWFHIPQPGEPGYKEPSQEETDAAKSSLEQLIEEQDTSDNFKKYETQQTEEDVIGLTEEVLIELAEFMNPHYLDLNIISQMSDRFVEESAVQCKQFLNDETLAKLEAVTTDLDKQDKVLSGNDGIAPHGTGVRDGWIVQGPPHRSRFMINNSKDDIFAYLKSKFESEAFRVWLNTIAQVMPIGYRGQARRFRPGHDYTLATTNTRGQALLDVTFCNVHSPERWEDGEVGGYECYMAPHDEEEDAAVYKAADDDGALLSLSAGRNELSLVLRDEGIMRFTKYISAKAPGSRWDVAFEYDLPEGFGDESEEEEDNDDEE
ncbi:Oxoglutarate and iron-dependent oxygenase degradation C-term-domain-containing protein [Thamnidium elegans]|nr:Oxoglutarate and iron-dependent oxygenase degradation C-term-domain-containing protein [Thamnidium elegans]